MKKTPITQLKFDGKHDTAGLLAPIPGSLKTTHLPSCAEMATNLPPPLVYRNLDTSHFKKIQRSLVQISITYGTEIPHFPHWNVGSPEKLEKNVNLTVLPGGGGDISFAFQKPLQQCETQPGADELRKERTRTPGDL